MRSRVGGRRFALFAGLMSALCGLMTSTLVGCAEGENCGARCLGDIANLRVKFSPSLAEEYKVELELDGIDGGFTCANTEFSLMEPTDQTGVADTVRSCGGSGFSIMVAPDFASVAVTAKDGLSGSASRRPDYVRLSRCPGGSEPCPPYAIFSVRLR